MFISMGVPPSCPRASKGIWAQCEKTGDSRAEGQGSGTARGSPHRHLHVIGKRYPSSRHLLQVLFGYICSCERSRAGRCSQLLELPSRRAPESPDRVLALPMHTLHGDTGWAVEGGGRERCPPHEDAVRAQSLLLQPNQCQRVPWAWHWSDTASAQVRER